MNWHLCFTILSLAAFILSGLFSLTSWGNYRETGEESAALAWFIFFILAILFGAVSAGLIFK